MRFPRYNYKGKVESCLYKYRSEDCKLLHTQLAINLINNNEMIENITTKTKVTMKRID